MNTEQNMVYEGKAKQNSILELLIILVLSITVYMISAYYDVLETVVQFSRRHESWELDEFIILSIFLTFVFALYSARMWKKVRNERDMALQYNNFLNEALAEIKQLRGIIPICASCKKIRDEEGYWHQVESYISDHSEAAFSHSVCNECAKRLYPEFVKDSKGNNQ